MDATTCRDGRRMPEDHAIVIMTTLAGYYETWNGGLVGIQATDFAGMINAEIDAEDAIASLETDDSEAAAALACWAAAKLSSDQLLDAYRDRYGALVNWPPTATDAVACASKRVRAAQRHIVRVVRERLELAEAA
jgi:hypothetical protein